MPYLLNTDQDRREMLAAIGATSLDDLFSSIPSSLQLRQPLDIPPALTELDLTRELSTLANKNRSPDDRVSFLGAGSYDHFIPAVVDYVASRGEYYTSYTPYQPEVSQGNLQVMFEYQTLVTRLTGMDVSNASLYDGASALAEAAMMSLAANRQAKRIVLLDSVHPEYRSVLETCLANLDAEIVTVPSIDGALDKNALNAAMNAETACVVFQQPNFFGGVDDVSALVDVAHRSGSLAIEVFDPISLGLLKRPGDYGVDIAVAEGQSLGLPMAFGGPYLGILACSESFVRKMPGRIAGQTEDHHGNRCWVLTLQTREQHIRREKATSNICTNQGLCALRAAVYLAAVGPAGLREVAALCFHKATYLKQRFAESERFELAYQAPTWREFVIRDRDNRVPDLIAAAESAGYFAGVPLEPWRPDLADCFLVAVTEKRTQEELDGLIEVLSSVEAGEEAPCA